MTTRTTTRKDTGMLADDMLRQMKRDEAFYDKEIADAITARLNDSKTKAAADKVQKTSGGWPYPSNKKLLILYQKIAREAWKNMKSGYESLDVEIVVDTLFTGAPYARATTKHRGELKGGMSHVLRPGDTVANLSKEIYGSETFADDILTHNAKVLGPKCVQIPAGFGIEIPQIWVPDWKSPPKGKVANAAKKPAVQIMKPVVEVDIDKSKAQKYVFPAGPVIVEVTLTVSATLLAQQKGTIDASFNLRTYKASCAKDLGPIAGNVEADFKSLKGSGSLSIKMPKIPGVKGTTKLTLKPGGKIGTTLAEKKVTFKNGNTTYTGTVKLDAEIAIKPNPVPPPVRVRRPKPIKVDWKVVVPVVVVVGVVVVGGSVLSVGSGTPALAQGAALVVGGLLASSA